MSVSVCVCECVCVCIKEESEDINSFFQSCHDCVSSGVLGTGSG